MHYTVCLQYGLQNKKLLHQARVMALDSKAKDDTKNYINYYNFTRNSLDKPPYWFSEVT